MNICAVSILTLALTLPLTLPLALTLALTLPPPPYRGQELAREVVAAAAPPRPRQARHVGRVQRPRQRGIG